MTRQGASAILEYNTLRSPLGQPRNALMGHTISALVGVSISKLFQLMPEQEYEHVRWIAGAISCGTASALMLLTGTVHPPGGASAVLAATSPEITAMGWYFVPLVMYGTSLMLVVGLVVNNIHRRFPVYWWTPINLRELQRRRKAGDVESNDTPKKIANTLRDGDESTKGMINISAYEVDVPEDMVLSEEEVEVLERLKGRLRKRGQVVEAVNEESGPSSRSSTDDMMTAIRSMERSESEKGILDSQRSDSEKGILDSQS
jgi:CBS-domain-containing membrane protein